jgi:hypothetical protein
LISVNYRLGLANRTTPLYTEHSFDYSINYTASDGKLIEGKQVSITNRNGTMLWDCCVMYGVVRAAYNVNPLDLVVTVLVKN